MTGNYGFWLIGGRNGLEGAASTWEELPDGRTVLRKDPTFPAVMEDQDILFSVRSSNIALRDLHRLLPNLDDISKSRIETLMRQNPKSFKVNISDTARFDYIEKKANTKV